jgi:hypothetical protein
MKGYDEKYVQRFYEETCLEMSGSKPGKKCKNYIKLEFSDVDCEGVKWNELAQDCVGY